MISLAALVTAATLLQPTEQYRSVGQTVSLNGDAYRDRITATLEQDGHLRVEVQYGRLTKGADGFAEITYEKPRTIVDVYDARSDFSVQLVNGKRDVSEIIIWRSPKENWRGISHVPLAQKPIVFHNERGVFSRVLLLHDTPNSSC